MRWLANRKAEKALKLIKDTCAEIDRMEGLPAEAFYAGLALADIEAHGSTAESLYALADGIMDDPEVQKASFGTAAMRLGPEAVLAIGMEGLAIAASSAVTGAAFGIVYLASSLGMTAEEVDEALITIEKELMETEAPEGGEQ